LSKLPASEKPSLARVFAIPVQDLESQDHILAFQLPFAIRKYNVGLVILDSVAANYRAEHGSAIPRDLAHRAAQLAKLGQLLRDLAGREKIAIVVANQVSDRFEELNIAVAQHRPHPSSPMMSSSQATPNGPGAPPSSAGNTDTSARDSAALSLDFQQRFFTGWGDELYRSSSKGLKTPALGLAWTNQIACRIALKMEAARVSGGTNDRILASHEGGNIWNEKKKRRFLRLVFAPWAQATSDPVEYEIRPEGIASCNTNHIEA
jgi:DNA repair protein RAD57